MSFIPAKYDFPDHYKGTTLCSKQFDFNFDITGVDILCQIKKKPTDKDFIYSWESGVNITIIDSLSGIFVLDQVNEFNKPVGEYCYDLRLFFPDGTNFVYIQGGFRIVQNISRVV